MGFGLWALGLAGHQRQGNDAAACALDRADDFRDVAKSIVERLKAGGARAHLDDRSETLNYRIREAETLKIPYMAIVGKREAESDSIALRIRGAGKKQDVMPVADFIDVVKIQIETRALSL